MSARSFLNLPTGWAAGSPFGSRNRCDASRKAGSMTGERGSSAPAAATVPRSASTFNAPASSSRRSDSRTDWRTGVRPRWGAVEERRSWRRWGSRVRGRIVGH